MGELNPAITITDLSFSFGKTRIIGNASADIGSGRFTVVLGRNGSGKSTLLRVMAGLLKPESGRVMICGHDLRTLRPAAGARLFAFLGQKHRAVFPFTVLQVVLTGRAAHVRFVPSESDRQVALAALRRAGIEHLRDRIYTELSGGEQQLVMIARVLAQEPQVLLLDEPTTHLDFTNQVRLLGLLKELTRGGLTVVAVLHDPGLAFLYGDDFLFLLGGKVVRPDPPHAPWSRDFLSTIYGHDLKVIPYEGRALVVPVVGE